MLVNTGYPSFAATTPVLSAIPASDGILVEAGNSTYWWIDGLGVGHRIDSAGNVMSHVEFGDRNALRYFRYGDDRFVAIYAAHAVIYDRELRPVSRITFPASARLNAGLLRTAVLHDSRLPLYADLGVLVLDLKRAQAELVLTTESPGPLATLLASIDGQLLEVSMEGSGTTGGQNFIVNSLNSQGEVFGKYRLVNLPGSCGKDLFPVASGLVMVCGGPTKGIKTVVLGRRGRVNTVEPLPQVQPSGWGSISEEQLALETLTTPWSIQATGKILVPTVGVVQLDRSEPQAVQVKGIQSVATPMTEMHSFSSAVVTRDRLGNLHWVTGSQSHLWVRAINALPIFVDSTESTLTASYLGGFGLTLRDSFDWLERGWSTHQNKRAPVAFQSVQASDSEMPKVMEFQLRKIGRIMKIGGSSAQAFLDFRKSIGRLAQIDPGTDSLTFQTAGMQFSSLQGLNEASQGLGRTATPITSPAMQTSVDGVGVVLHDYLNPAMDAVMSGKAATVGNTAWSNGVFFFLSGDTGSITWFDPKNQGRGNVSGTYAALFQLDQTVYAINFQDELVVVEAGRVRFLAKIPSSTTLKVEGHQALMLGERIASLRNGVLTNLNVSAQVRDASISTDGFLVTLTGTGTVRTSKVEVSYPGSQQVFQFNNRIFLLHSDGHASLLNRDLTLIATVHSVGNGLLVMTPEGYFSGFGSYLDYLNVVETNGSGARVFPIAQFFDIFHRPDIVRAKLLGDEHYVRKASQELTLEKAIRRPPPVVSIQKPASVVATERLRLSFTLRTTGGGVGEVLIFHNGKLVKSDGYYRDAPGSALVAINTTKANSADSVQRGQAKLLGAGESTLSPSNGGSVVVRQAQEKSLNASGEYTSSIEIDVLPGEENEVTILGRNAEN
ncbi:MAG: hypothetical protein E6Q78_09845 [Rhodoferax sp.]|nr:MAG: hypothetical protein E6Q78_09845 [Rhodoferax sp.]